MNKDLCVKYVGHIGYAVFSTSEIKPREWAVIYVDNYSKILCSTHNSEHQACMALDKTARLNPSKRSLFWVGKREVECQLS